MQVYWMKCRARREIKNPRSVVFNNRRPATQGVCPVCGTEVFRIGKSQLELLVGQVEIWDQS